MSAERGPKVETPDPDDGVGKETADRSADGTPRPLGRVASILRSGSGSSNGSTRWAAITP